MSKTKKGAKGPGFEYWSKRPNSMSQPGKASKKVTHKKERGQSKKAIKKESNE
jgi:hypothetical protein